MQLAGVRSGEDTHIPHWRTLCLTPDSWLSLVSQSAGDSADGSGDWIPPKRAEDLHLIPGSRLWPLHNLVCHRHLAGKWADRKILTLHGSLSFSFSNKEVEIIKHIGNMSNASYLCTCRAWLCHFICTSFIPPNQLNPTLWIIPTPHHQMFKLSLHRAGKWVQECLNHIQLKNRQELKICGCCQNPNSLTKVLF